MAFLGFCGSCDRVSADTFHTVEDANERLRKRNDKFEEYRVQEISTRCKLGKRIEQLEAEKAAIAATVCGMAEMVARCEEILEHVQKSEDVKEEKFQKLVTLMHSTGSCPPNELAGACPAIKARDYVRKQLETRPYVATSGLSLSCDRRLCWEKALRHVLEIH